MKLRSGLLGLALLALFSGLVASGSTLAPAQNRVRGSNDFAVARVGVFSPSAARLQLGNGQSYDGTAADSRHAPEALESPLVARGGLNDVGRILNGSGVTVDEAGYVQGVSVNVAQNLGEDLLTGVANKQIGLTTVHAIERAGGYVKPDALEGNPFHCLVGGLTAEVLSGLLTPTVSREVCM